MVAPATDRSSAETDELAVKMWNSLPAVRAEFSDSFSSFKALLARDPSALADEIRAVGGTVPTQASAEPTEEFISVNEATARAVWLRDSGIQAEFGSYASFFAAFKSRPSLFINEIRAVPRRN